MDIQAKLQELDQLKADAGLISDGQPHTIDGEALQRISDFIDQTVVEVLEEAVAALPEPTRAALDRLADLADAIDAAPVAA